MRVALLVYRLTLLLYPAAFRRDYGRDMSALFARDLARAQARGLAALMGATVVGSADALVRAVREWRRHRHQRLRAPTREHKAKPSLRSLELLMDTLSQDVRHAVRSLRRTPGWSAVALLTLALGIGANSAIFSVVYGVILRPLPFPEPERFVHLGWDWGTGPRSSASLYHVDYWRRHTVAFTAIATYRGFATTIAREESDLGTPVRGLRVSHEFFSALGVVPALGRRITADEHAPGGAAVAVISDRLWKTAFANRVDVLGQELYLRGAPHRIIGVLPAGFEFPQAPEYTDVIISLGLRPDPADESHNYPVIARLRPDASKDAAEMDLRRVFDLYRAEYPDLVGDNGRGLGLTTYQDFYVGSVQATLWVLMGATAVVLLIACANVASLLMARASGRRHEIAVRAALGATRGHLLRLALTESVITSLAGAAVGIVFARFGVDVLLGSVPDRLPRTEYVGVDWTVLGFTFVVALVVGSAVGMAAAFPSSRERFTASALKEGSRGSASRGRGRQALVIVETALSMVLLVGAGLLLGTLVRLRSVDAGFEARGIVMASFPSRPSTYGSAGALWDLQRRVINRLSANPAVEGAAGASTVPLQRGQNIPVTIEGTIELMDAAVEWRAVTDGYFETLAIPIVRGRGFRAFDAPGARRVAVVNESFAAHHFPDSDPIGQRLEIGRWRGRYVHGDFDVPAAEIIGVVADIREVSLRQDARRTVLVPQGQAPELLTGMPTIMIRTRYGVDAGQLLQDALADVDPALPTPIVRPMDDMVAASLAQERFSATLMGAFAGLALMLTACGIFGVVSHGVRLRRREMGIRIALGAKTSEVARLVVGQGMVPVLVGVGIGTASALGLTRFIASMVWGVSPTDPATMLAVGGLLAGVALLASYVPAREATLADPLEVLRAE